MLNKRAHRKKIQYHLLSLFFCLSLSACSSTSVSNHPSISTPTVSSDNKASDWLGSLVAGAVVSAVIGNSGSSASPVGAIHEANTSNQWLVPLVVSGAKAVYDNQKNHIDVTPDYVSENKKDNGQIIIVSPKGQRLPQGFSSPVIDTVTLKNISISLSLISAKKSAEVDLKRLKKKYPNLHIQPNYYYYLDGKISRPARPIPQYALKMLGLTNKKQTSLGGSGIRIGVIDTPIDKTHPVLSSASINQVNLLKNKNTGRLHATVLAGILVAHGRLQGVAPRAAITAVGAFEESKKSNSSGRSTSFLLAKAFDTVIGARVNVLNLSFGSTEKDPLMQRLITETLKNKIIVVASVGNDGHQTAVRYPAALKGVLGITALDSKARLYKQANTGKEVDYALPGVNIISSKPGGRYTSISGTSFSSAYATGLIALQLSKYKNINALNKTVKDLGVSGKDSRFGYGLLKSF